SDRGGPPLAAALCGWDAVGIELAGDLAQAPPGGVRGLDSFDYLFGDPPRAASVRRRGARLGRPSTLREQAVELVDRDQPCAPWKWSLRTCARSRYVGSSRGPRSPRLWRIRLRPPVYPTRAPHEGLSPPPPTSVGPYNQAAP